MKIVIYLTFNDNEIAIPPKEKYFHNSHLGFTKGYGITLKDKEGKNITNCYPFENKSECAIAFTHQGTRIICRCSFTYKKNKITAIHNGTAIIRDEYDEMLKRLSEEVIIFYTDIIKGTLKVGDFAKIEFEWKDGNLQRSKEIKFGYVELFGRNLFKK